MTELPGLDLGSCIAALSFGNATRNEQQTAYKAIEALQKDAERYRWLKTWDKTDGFSDDAIDREIAIDAAIQSAAFS